MTPAVVVDIGNTRMKWGRVVDGRIADHVSLPLDGAVEWKKTFRQWLPLDGDWLISGVVPKAMVRLTEWMESRRIQHFILNNQSFYQSVAPDFFTKVEEPDVIGIDRLVNSYAAFAKSGGKRPLAVISVGTAMTVDFIATNGQHVGGAILPGLRLMAKSLNDYTALLPLVSIELCSPHSLWGATTNEAIVLGIASALQGAADRLVWQWAKEVGPIGVFITGGDQRFFQHFKFAANPEWVTMDELLTLDGLRLIAGKMQ